MAKSYYDYLGNFNSLSRSSNKQRRFVRRTLFPGLGMIAPQVEMKKIINTQKMEAGMFPGVILQMCYWYRPDEMSVRLLYFCESGNKVEGSIESPD